MHKSGRRSEERGLQGAHWAIAKIHIRRYEYIELKVSSLGTSSAVRGGRLLANWNTGLLYVRAEPALRLTRALRDAPWAPRIRRLAILVPSTSPDTRGGGSSEDLGSAGPRFETLANIVRALCLLRYAMISPYMEDVLALDDFGFCGVNTYKEAYEAAKNENPKVVRPLREHIDMLDGAGPLWSRDLSWEAGGVG
ncbi:hypothetical protein DL762_002610 [Monosporascus cannonballus]|uniref:Uncharacterized protein n=1 Tax=Monosporascus cannonballus TaxID=155416 RepID=A0ABY0HCZ8_9PEZI|nr:hypothetical protein DL762_002610 [Monosporascus cannonballus]